MDRNSPEAWHLDRKVPIAFIVALMMQGVGGIWFISNLSSKVDQLVRANDKQDERIQTVEQAAQSQAVSSASITQQIGSIKDTLNQMRQDQRDMNALLRQYMESKK